MTEHANTSRSLSPEAEQMSHDEKYLFDLTGFLIVRDVLSDEHLKLANEAIEPEPRVLRRVRCPAG